MSEQVCIEEWGCCFDSNREESCFKPKPLSSGVSAGITAGAAVGALFACLGITMGGFLYYRNYGLNLPSAAVTASFTTPFSPSDTAA